MENYIIETPYLKMPRDVALMMASMLSLGKERKPFITLGYTESDTEYAEPILNLRWSLVGEWVVLNFKKMFKDDTISFEKFLDLLQTEKDYFKRNQKLAYLCGPGFSSDKLEVEGRCLEDGVTNLFLKLTEKTEIQKGEKKMFLPVVMVQIERSQNYNSFSAYMYIEEQKSFVNIWWPNETPNYVKKFLEFEKNMLGETAG